MKLQSSDSFEQTIAMDQNVTRQMNPGKVLYRCTCGVDLHLDPTLGGNCTRCEKFISPKVLGHELALTMTLLDGSFEIVETGAAAFQNANAVTVRTDRQLPSSEEDPDVLIGESFGHFEVVATLGRGGMGQVYRALDKSLQRYVAVKLLRSGIGNGSNRLSKSSDTEIDKLLQEAISQARVSHPNIVTIYYVGKQAGDPFLAMELVNGKPLSGRIADGNLSFTDIASIAVQITEALRFSYDLDIIHGDIKPSNVLVQQNGVAKLSDFGMARRVSSECDDAIGGTPNYIAPELLKGGKPSLQSDVYALGVTLFEMTFSRLPITITGSTVPEWIIAHENGRPQFPTHWPDQLPEAWKDLLVKMLAQDPGDRYNSYDDLLIDLKRLAPRSQVIARPFPRIVAAGIDWISVMILVLGIQATFTNSSWNPLVTNVLHALDFAPILLFTAVVYFWRQSLGSSLMHIRVVNRYGLSPTRVQMMLRSLLRMQFPWFATLLSFFDNPLQSWVGIAILVLVVLAGVGLVIDVGFMMFYQKRRSLHDLVFGTSVILDTEQ